MKTTLWQPPNMKGKKTYSFSCGCCTAKNCLEQKRNRIEMQEAVVEAYSREAQDVYYDELEYTYYWLTLEELELS